MCGNVKNKTATTSGVTSPLDTTVILRYGTNKIRVPGSHKLVGLVGLNTIE